MPVKSVHHIWMPSLLSSSLNDCACTNISCFIINHRLSKCSSPHPHIYGILIHLSIYCMSTDERGPSICFVLFVFFLERKHQKSFLMYNDMKLSLWNKCHFVSFKTFNSKYYNMTYDINKLTVWVVILIVCLHMHFCFLCFLCLHLEPFPNHNKYSTSYCHDSNQSIVGMIQTNK